MMKLIRIIKYAKICECEGMFIIHNRNDWTNFDEIWNMQLMTWNRLRFMHSKYEKY